MALTEAGQALAQAMEAPLAALRALGAGWPLDALPRFEAAVRKGGFDAAGAELGLTAGAIAVQVRAVERGQGRALFQRGPRGVDPLPEGVALQTALAPLLALVAQALAANAGSPIRIAALLAVAQLWLAPRLPALRAAFPGLALTITALERLPKGKTAPHDLTLVLADRGGVLLAEDALVPVCAPARIWPDCPGWPIQPGRAIGGPGRRPPGSPATVPSLDALAVGEAVAGEGVLIGHRALLARHLRAGNLVAPIGPVLPLPAGLRLRRQRPLASGSLPARVAEWLAASARGEWYSLPGLNGGPPDPQSGALTN